MASSSMGASFPPGMGCGFSWAVRPFTQDSDVSPGGVAEGGGEIYEKKQSGRSAFSLDGVAQAVEPGGETAVRNVQHGEAAAEVDAAGIQEGTLATPVVEGLVGVAEEEAVQPPLLSEIARLQEGGLHPQAVAVAEVEPQPLQDQGLLLRLAGAVVAVAPDLVEGDVRVMAVEVPGEDCSNEWREAVDPEAYAALRED